MMDLKTARFIKKKTQFDLTLITGIHQSKLSNFESGYLKPSEDEVKRLAKALGVKADDLNWKHE